MSPRSTWEKRINQGKIIGIVKNKQPSRLCLKPLAQCLHHFPLLIGNFEQSCNSLEISQEVFPRFRSDPENGLIMLTKMIGIFCRSLRFSHSAEGGERLRRNHPHIIL